VNQRPGTAQSALVTGGAGFIGSHLVERLLHLGRRVTVIDNLSTGRRENLPVNERLAFEHADLADAAPQIGEHGRLGAFDEIYHLAAAVGVKLIMDDPVGAIETNVGLTARLLETAARAGPGGTPAPTLIASSSEVYGKGAQAVFSEDDDAVYGPTTVTRWSYAASKALDEHLALAYHARRGLPTVIVRFFNTVGPRQVGEYGMVLPRFIAAALAGEPLTVYGDGAQSRCFGDVRDAVRALPALLGTPSCWGRVFNLGSDRPVTIRELAEMVLRVTGSRSAIVNVPYESAYPAGFEDLRRRRPDLARIRGAIGYDPAVPLEQTVADIAATMTPRPRSEARR
jgi:UDP-glucose 4-epimerase